MITYEQLKELALSFPEAEEQAHFEKPSFRVKKKIFVTYDAKNNIACIKLSAIEQSVFSAYDATIIYAVPNAWGKQGWTFVDLNKVKKTVFKDALKTSYGNVATAKLIALLKK